MEVDANEAALLNSGIVLTSSHTLKEFFVFPADRIARLMSELSGEDAQTFLREIEEAAKPFRANQLKAEESTFRKWLVRQGSFAFSRIAIDKAHPPAGSKPEDYPEDSPMRQQMQTPGQPKPKPSMETK